MDDKTEHESAGLGHNRHSEPTKYVRARHTKKRTFVRALEGTYGKLVRSLFDNPRVYHMKDFKWSEGPQTFGKTPINPEQVQITQSIESHYGIHAPGGHSAMHGHMNSAVFYIIKGNGYDIHDGRRIEYETGDAVIVENACVHQHCADPDSELEYLVMKAKPLFLFMHMIFQKVVNHSPEDAVSGYEGWKPVEYEERHPG
jgi:mannose-6-phosphate isomerase-like protein (cupin superfamily)